MGGGEKPPFYDRDSTSRAYSLICGLDNHQRVFFGVRLLLTSPPKEIAISQSGKTTKRPVTDVRPVAWITHAQPRYHLTIHYGSGDVRELEVDGFKVDKYVFQATNQLGVLLSPNAHLKRGDYYIFQKGDSLDLPPEFNAQRRVLRDAANFNGWSVFSFTVPATVRDGARSWFTDVTGYCLAFDAIKYAVLQPQSAYSLGNDSWQIEAEMDWAVLVKFPFTGQDTKDIYIQRRNEDLQYEGLEAHFDIKETRGYVLISGTASEATNGSVYRIALRSKTGGLSLLTELSCVAGIQEPRCDRLGFVIDNVRWLWSSHLLPHSLEQVRLGKSFLTKIEVPDGVRLRARADLRESHITTAAELVSFLKSSPSRIGLLAEGHCGKGDGTGHILLKEIVARKFSPIKNRGSSVSGQLRGRHADAFMRGQASEYATLVKANGDD
jgi:hypothetical protein